MPIVVPAAPRVAHATLPCAVGVLLGGALVSSEPPPVLVACACGGAVLLLVVATLTAGRARVTVVALALGFAAAAVTTLGRAAPPAGEHIARRISAGAVAVEGVVESSDHVGTTLRLTLRAERYRSPSEQSPTRGLLGVTVAHPRRAWPVGARVRAVGRLRTPRNFGNPGGYDLRRALARHGIHVTMFLWDDGALDLLTPAPRGMTSLVAALRAGVESRVDAVTEQPGRGFLAAVLVGTEGALPRDIWRILARTGLSHVVSVSGFHLAVVAGAAILAVGALLRRSERMLLAWNAQKVSALAGIVPVLAYSEIAGGSVPATRALVMYAAVLVALFANRPVDGPRALAAAGVLLALAVPDIAADIGFELSFVSVAALIVVARRRAAGGAVDAPWSRRRLLFERCVVTPLQASIAAAVATAPLTAWHFQQVSLIAPLANLVVLPLLGPATLLPGLAALPLLAVAPALGDGLLRLAAGAAAIGLRLAAVLAALPGAAVTTPMPNLLEVSLCYAALGLSLVPRDTGKHSRRLMRLRRVAVGVVVAAVIGDIGYWAWERGANPHLRVTFLSVGQGDAAVVELPRGGVMVVDGGGLGTFDTGERLIAPFLHARKILRIDTMVLSHPQLDHYGGLAYLAEHFAPREFWWNGMRTDAAGFARLERALERAGTQRVVLRRGAPPIVRGDVVVDVLHPGVAPLDDLNNGSLVVRLRYSSLAVLFSGDIEHEAEREIAASLAGVADGPTMPAASTVLKVPHHGSATSSTATLLAAVRPRVAVISAGADNRFGFPARTVLERLTAVGAMVWRTDLDGAIRVESDGVRLTVDAPCGRRDARTIDLKSPYPFDSS